MGEPRDAPIAWPPSCYPAAIQDRYQLLECAPGPRALRELLPRYLRPGIRVLDIGCGIGSGACHIAASGGWNVRYTGIDPDIAACRQARRILAELPAGTVRGHIVERSLEDYLEATPPQVDLILWTFSFHDCLDVMRTQTHAPVCAAVAGLLPPGGLLLLMDGVFAPGASAAEIERTYIYIEAIVGHCDRGRYFPPESIAGLFTGAGFTMIEQHDVPLVALARYLGLPHARAALFVFVK